MPPLAPMYGCPCCTPLTKTFSLACTQHSISNSWKALGSWNCKNSCSTMKSDAIGLLLHLSEWHLTVILQDVLCNIPFQRHLRRSFDGVCQENWDSFPYTISLRYPVLIGSWLGSCLSFDWFSKSSCIFGHFLVAMETPQPVKTQTFNGSMTD